MAEKEFHAGDHVSWASHSGRAYGVVKEKLVDRTHVRGHAVDASEDQPQYRVRHDTTGRDVAHRPEVLRRERE
ncbi:DUF2945 domain-containing protein [Micromonospora krabiensis]|uniref:Hypervirulence associated protein TUDOR domain-containing protein n=1 Tax=Micromonospora krabiensis TaxID=307121 RepID=A0A1C3NDK6_9ACTN|nr:DUF2945 domain-containing protein [Micromonospora krabiensis]SBV30631.1 Protein of unknown function [Micromonospora krabiensis]